MFSNFDFDVIIRSLPYLFYQGMTFTLLLTALATLGGIVLGTLLALMRLSGFALLTVPAAVYVNLMRSVPFVLMIIWFYFLVPYIGQWVTFSSRPIQVGAFASCLVTFTLFEAAFFCGSCAPAFSRSTYAAIKVDSVLDWPRHSAKRLTNELNRVAQGTYDFAELEQRLLRDPDHDIANGDTEESSSDETNED